MFRISRALLFPVLFVLLGSQFGWAQTALPHLTSVTQSGGQHGTTVTVTLSGVNIGYGTALLLEGTGLTVESLKPEPVPPPTAKNPTGNLVTSVRIAPDALPGRRALRVLTPFGVSDVGYIVIGQWPEVAEKEPNDSRAQAQALTGPVTVLGACGAPEDMDYYRIALKQGETCVFEAQADSIGSPLQPTLVLQDAEGHELGLSGAFTRPDAFLTYTAPKTGDYFLLIHDMRFQGGGEYRYRLTVGVIPYVTGVFPLGGIEGTIANFALAGFNLGSAPVAHFPLPAAPLSGTLTLPLPLANGFSNSMRLAINPPGSPPEVQETEPNDDAATAQRITVPCTINGRIQSAAPDKSDTDCFRFRLEKGQGIVLEVMARRAGSRLDSVLTLLNGNGQTLASNDDALDKDSRLEFTAPEAGEYVAQIADLNGQSGADFPYRLQLTFATPDFQIAYAPDCPAVGPGDRIPLTVTATRLRGFNDEITLNFAGLPAGMHVLGTPKIEKGQNQAVLYVTADANAARGTSPLQVTGTASISGKAVTHWAQSLVEELVKVENGTQRTTRPTKFPFAAVVGPPDVIVASGADTLMLGVGKTVELPIHVARAPGFTGKISLLAQGLPNGVTVTNPEIPANQSDFKLVLKAEGNAAPGEVNFVLTGRVVISELLYTDHASLPVHLTLTK